ncbi:MAG: type III-A CRISPR-associated RAMP protein Csm3 [Candidatus Desulfofervidaceae bacterium]|nr:type III-A CRISPR-associated RAMP protein Csm3 [Candidatus Desulfofervidaceae bacterium]
MNYRLLEIKEIKGTIKLLTGLHIGAGNDEIKIGGIDNPVIKHPITGEPYIPGSSLKGKARSLLEWQLGKIRQDGKPWDQPDDDKGKAICRIFGISGADAGDYNEGPSRALFRDCRLTEKGKKFLMKDKNVILFEDKSENTIDRIKATANPRHMERVPAGAEFEFVIHYKIMDINGDNGEVDRKNFKYLLQALKLLEMDALGGCGSRGYGRIEFKFEDSEIKAQFKDLKLFEDESED